MRLGFFYPSKSVARPIDPSAVWTSPRGLTGSEVSCVMYALEMSRRGHDVTLFSRFVRGGDIEKITCCQYDEWENIYCKQKWDVLCSWMLPDPFEHAQPGQLRIYNQQVSDFTMCRPGWESNVDFITPLSHSHANYMFPQCSVPKERWRIMYNGVDMTAFKPNVKVAGKVIWASSHDRGLHWLLEAWPKVRSKVPYATLHVFYDFNGIESFSKWENADLNVQVNRECCELGQRSRYTVEALKRLESHGVIAHRSVSRDRIRQEMANSLVLAYPCDPVKYTETFGVTVLEACASGSVPVICTADAFEELWGHISVSVPSPYKDHKQKYLDNLILALTDADFRKPYFDAGVEYAHKFDWKILVNDLEDFFFSRGASGLQQVNWKS